MFFALRSIPRSRRRDCRSRTPDRAWWHGCWMGLEEDLYTDHRYLVDQKQPLSAQFQRHQLGEKKGQPFNIALSGYACGARWCGAPIESWLCLSGPGCGRHLIRRTCHLSNTHAVVRDLFPTHSRTDRRRDCGWDQTPSSFFTLAVARRQAKVHRGVTRGSFTLFHRYRALTSDSSVDVPIFEHEHERQHEKWRQRRNSQSPAQA